MAIYAIITDGVVSNAVVSETKLDESWVLCPEGVGYGWQYDGTNFSAPSIVKTEAEAKEDRLKMLKETDFYGFSDVTMTSEMATYRQALRDLPAQEGFPNTITWPTKPE